MINWYVPAGSPESSTATWTERGSAVLSYDDQREVRLDDDDLPILPDQTTDDTDRGWGQRRARNDVRLLEDRPPHWDWDRSY